MADIVAIFFVERVVGDKTEGMAPKDKAIVQGEANTFEKQRVLQTAVILEVTVFTQSAMEVTHAEGEMLG